jgi:hypothetical protein
MSTPLQSLHYHVGEDPDLAPDATAASLENFPVAASAAGDDAPARTFTSTDGAARFGSRHRHGQLSQRPCWLIVIPDIPPGLGDQHQ